MNCVDQDPLLEIAEGAWSVRVPKPVTLLYICLKREALRVFAKPVLREFWTKHADCEEQLKAWFREAEKAKWKSTNAIKREYPSASILKDNRIVFNIKGNKYRLIVKFNCAYQVCWIRFIGTHAHYDKIDANTI